MGLGPEKGGAIVVNTLPSVVEVPGLVFLSN
jgi:hypothetical protein